KFAGVRGVGCEFLHKGPEYGGDEGGSHAVAHDVTNEYSSPSVRKGTDIEEVAPDSPGGQVSVTEAEGAFLGGGTLRKTGVLLRDDSLLNFASHPEIFLHLFVAHSQFLLTERQFQVGLLYRLLRPALGCDI